MNDDVLVKVEGVSKKFCRSLKRSLWYGVQDVAGELLGRKGNSERLRKNEFWAVRDVSFELRRGECLGLIGPNGAGKSTVLKLLNGLIKPDNGQITIRGRVGALIELGAGFNPILTARENIYVNGTVLGFRKSEIQKKFDSIIDFAEIDKFVDTPVQNFSSGMKVRLGFAIATMMEPDVLLIDEVLAVGDAGFRMKCFNAIRELSSEAAVILVSHQMPEIARSCSKGLLLDTGRKAAASNDVSSVIREYFEKFRPLEPLNIDGPYARIKSVRVLNNEFREALAFDYMDDVLIEVVADIDKEIETPTFGVSFLNPNLQLVLQCHSTFDGFRAKNRGGESKILLKLKELPLGPGAYSVSVGIDGPEFDQQLARCMNAKSIRIVGSFVGFAPVVMAGEWQSIEAVNSNS